jgi:hypothetical protein
MLLCIYIKKKVCLFVMHLNTVRPNAMKFCMEYPLVQEKVVGNFSTQNFHLKGGLCPSYCWIYYSKCLFQRICAYDCFLNNSRTKVYKNLHFLPLDTRYCRILGKKTNRMYKIKRNGMNGNIHRMKKVTSEMEFHYSCPGSQIRQRIRSSYRIL